MDGQTALITGASCGIGRELARVFAAEGHDVVLVARRRKNLDALARELTRHHGIRALALMRDLSRPNAAQALFHSVRKHGISVDVLVNNAGILHNGDFGRIPVAAHLDLLQLNVVVPTVLSRLFLGPMLKRGHGRILNVASIAAFQPLARLAAYASTKAYILHLTEALSEELVGTGVTATALCPGFTDTKMLSEMPGLSFLPSFAISSAEEVARDGYEACMSGTPTYVSGVASQLITQFIRYQPRWLVRAINGMYARQYR